MVLPNLQHLCPLQFNYQQALHEEPENELVIISLQGVQQHPGQLMAAAHTETLLIIS